MYVCIPYYALSCLPSCFSFNQLAIVSCLAMLLAIWYYDVVNLLVFLSMISLLLFHAALVMLCCLDYSTVLFVFLFFLLLFHRALLY
jgi:hypothetical protein